METKVQFAILRTLSYFQVFKYPLTIGEIWKYLPQKCSYDTFKKAIVSLENTGMIFETEDYYSLYKNQMQIARRKEGNSLGKKKLKTAMLISRFLGSFPFVEAVCISGSLSKDFALDDSDLDYFIITAPNRLWIARNLLHFFRKISFLVNAQGYLCMNYFVSLQEPEIFPKNYYTAIELATLKTAVSRKGITEFAAANNSWTSRYLPNASLTNNMANGKNKKWILTRCFEFLVNKLYGDRIEAFFYKTTMSRWTRKWSKQGYDVDACMRSAGPHVNTPINYPTHLPEDILREYETIYKAVELAYYRKTSTLAPAA